MSIKWVENGTESGWLVKAGPIGRRSSRLFVARKHGGKQATLVAAKQYEQLLGSLLEPATLANSVKALWARVWSKRGGAR